MELRIATFKPLTRALTLLIVTALAVLPMLVSPRQAQAATLVVNTLADNGPGNCFSTCTLRDAINTASPGDTITFQSGLHGQITLTRSFVLNKDLTIQGPGPSVIQIDGNNHVQVFSIGGGTVNISGLGIQHGIGGQGGGIWNGSTLTVSNSTFFANSVGSGSGGGIYNNGTLTVSNSTFSVNLATGGSGGGVYNNGTLTVSNSTFDANSAWEGGGIYNAATLRISNSTIAGNSVAVNGIYGPSGGGIYSSGTLTVSNSTFSANSVGGNGGGGGIYTIGTLTVSNCTFSGNQAPYGGGIYNTGMSTVSNSTVAGNSATFGGGIANALQQVSLGGTIVADNTAGTGPDFWNTITSLGNNLIGNPSGASGSVASDQLNVEPLLGGLSNTGGPTQTMALQPGSPAIGKGFCGGYGSANPPAPAVSMDQRGQVRKTACDVGAYEMPPTPPAITSPNSATFSVGVAGSFTVTTTGAPRPSLLKVGTLPGGVTFTDNGDGTGSLSGPAASGTAGSYPITLYADNGLSPLAQQLFFLTVVNSGPITPSISVPNASPNPSAYGANVTFTVIVSGPNGEPAPTGSVSFLDNGQPFGTGTLGPTTYLGQTVNAANYNTATLTVLPHGSNSITAHYTGDSHYTGVFSPVLAQMVLWPSTTSVTAAPSTTGPTVIFTVTVARGSGAPNTLYPSGSVELSENTRPLGKGTLAVSGGVSKAVISVATLSPGAHNISAAYMGDTNFEWSQTGSPLALAVKAMPPSFNPLVSPNPGAFGFSIGLSVYLFGAPNLPIPTGTITFKDGTTSLGQVTLTAYGGVGYAAMNVSTLSLGSHSITAVYSGDSNYFAKTSTAVTEVIKWGSVVKGLTTTASTTPVYGQPLQFTVTVGRASGVPATLTPTGTVTLWDQTAQIGSGTLVTISGVPTTIIKVPTLSVGVHTSLNANYMGDVNFVPSQFQGVPIAIDVGPANTTTAVTSSTSVSSLGQTVTFTAAVKAVVPSTAIVNGGTITFYDNGTALNSTPVNVVNGVATFSTTGLSLGSYQVTATYNGSANYNGSTGSEITHFVYRAPTGLLLTPSTSTATLGQPITYAITLKPTFPKAGTPTGSVTIKDGNTVLGSVTLQNGKATFTTSALGAGSHAINLDYNGDSNFLPGSAPGTVQSVKVPTTTTLSATANASIFGQDVTFTATVSPTATGSGAPTGVIIFKDGSVTLGSAALNNGAARFSTPRLTASSHSITATYSGDERDFGSTSPTFSQSVSKGTVTLGLNTSTNPATQSVTFTVVLSGGVPGVGIPGGTVTIQNNGVLLGTAQIVTITQNGVTTQQATFSAKLPAGTHTIVATYSGDGNYTPATSQPYTLTVAIQTASTTPTTGIGFAR